MINRRQAIAAAFGAAAAAVVPTPAKTVPFVVGPLAYDYDMMQWVDAETAEVVFRRKDYRTVVLPHGWKITRLPTQ
jgi:hypothetical protein